MSTTARPASRRTAPSHEARTTAAEIHRHFQREGGAFPRQQFVKYLEKDPAQQRDIRDGLRQRIEERQPGRVCRRMARRLHQLTPITKPYGAAPSDPFRDIEPLTLANTATSSVRDDHGVWRQGHAWWLYDIATYEPLLADALAGSSLHADLEVELDCERKDIVRSLQVRIEGGTWLDALHRVPIPKPSFAHPLCVALLDEFFAAAPLIGGPTRELVYPSACSRLLARTVARLFESWMYNRWSSSVACRSGRSIAQTVAALEHAIRKTGRTWVLMADVSDCFGSCRRADALNFLNEETGYRGDPDFRDYLHRLVPPAVGKSGQHPGLPQGNPLSPFLANLVCAERIDKPAQRHGPTIRYVDDLLVLVASRTAAQAAFAHIQEKAARHGLHLHPGKSVIANLATGEMFSCTADGTPVTGPIVYLGYELALAGSCRDTVLQIACSDKAIWRLADHLREALRDAGLDSAAQTRPIDEIPSRVVDIVQGWLQFYGVASRTSHQEEAFRWLLHRCGLHPDRLYLGELPRHTSPGERLRDLHERLRLPTVPTDEAGLRTAWAKRLTGIEDASSHRYREAQLDPLSLDWFEDGNRFRTGTRPEAKRGTPAMRCRRVKERRGSAHHISTDSPAGQVTEAPPLTEAEDIAPLIELFHELATRHTA